MGRGGESTATARGKKYSRAEVAKHNTPNDAWVVNNRKVRAPSSPCFFFFPSPMGAPFLLRLGVAR